MAYDSELGTVSADMLILQRARDLLKESWVNHAPQTEHEHCVATAIAKVSNHKIPPESLGFRDLGEVFQWNDAEGRTKAEVLALVDKAISTLVNGGKLDAPWYLP